jgi:hypothetical protein
MDDSINKKGVVFPIDTLESALEQSYQSGTPSCVSHDYLRPLAWIRPQGLLLDPVSCKVIGKLYIPQDEEEKTKLGKQTAEYIKEKHFIVDPAKKQELIDCIGINLLKGAQFCNFGFIGAIGKDIVYKLFPELFDDKDKNGLIDYRKIKSIAPGVFEIGKLIIFAHQFFRRNYTRLNNINEDFFMALDQIRELNCTIKIALDMDLVGLKNSFLRPLEFEYWWGPKFSNSIKDIPHGVTCYKADDRLKQFHQIDRTEFFWYKQDNHYAFECEEISDLDVKDCNFKFGCRYIHSMVNIENEEIIHLDGALRGYSVEKMVSRLDIDISKQDRSLEYIKLWRIDGNIPIHSWKELICHFYRDNYLPGEYLKPHHEKNSDKYLKMIKSIDNNLYEDAFFDIKQNNGIYVYVDYSPKEKFSIFHDDFNLATCDFCDFCGERFYYVDDTYIELQKLLKRKEVMISASFDYKHIAFEDLISNLPLIHHAGVEASKYANITLNAIKELVYLLYNNCKERIISFIIGVEYDNKIVTYSMMGNIVDMNNILSHDITIPFYTSEIPTFLKKIKSLNVKNINGLPLNNIKFINGMCYKRELIFRDSYQLCIEALRIAIEFYDRKIVEFMKKYDLEPATVNIINSSKCLKCAKEYKDCACIKYEGEKGVEIKDMIQLACVLTKHKA